MEYDKRPYGSHGRALKADRADLHLLKGDRLEPSHTLPDIAMFDNAALPITITFWRPSADTICRHRNPIFSDETGVTVQSCLLVDWLHTCSLGVFQDFLARLISDLVTANVWGVPMGVASVHFKLSIGRLNGINIAIQKTAVAIVKAWLPSCLAMFSQSQVLLNVVQCYLPFCKVRKRVVHILQ
jgi:hypothetical protein